jgi:hypothetical protein
MVGIFRRRFGSRQIFATDVRMTLLTLLTLLGLLEYMGYRDPLQSLADPAKPLLMRRRSARRGLVGSSTPEYPRPILPSGPAGRWPWLSLAPVAASLFSVDPAGPADHGGLTDLLLLTCQYSRPADAGPAGPADPLVLLTC